MSADPTTAPAPVPLPHHHFWEPASFAAERDRLFGRGWVFLGLAADLAGGGELTADLAGLRFAVRQGAGGLAGVCRDGAVLRPLAVETCGALVFARPADAGGPGLTAHLAPYGPRLAAMTAACDAPQPPVGIPFGANWKILIENTLDDFHGSTVHPETIHPAVHPDWQATLTTERHGANSDSCWQLADGTAAWWRRLDARLGFRRFAEEATYRHLFVFPNFYLAAFFGGAMLIAHRVEPVAPDAAMLRWQMALTAGRRGTAAEAAFVRATAAHLTASATRVIGEDRPVCEAVQQGRPAALGPGVYGRRERRLLDFHAALARHLGWETEA